MRITSRVPVGDVGAQFMSPRTVLVLAVLGIGIRGGELSCLVLHMPVTSLDESADASGGECGQDLCGLSDAAL